jgi:hypothetical protein
MNKAIAIMFIVLLLLLASGLAVSTYHLDKQIEINFNNAKVTDSLNEEIYMLQMSVDKQIFIVNQILEIHPNLVDSIIKNTE